MKKKIKKNKFVDFTAKIHQHENEKKNKNFIFNTFQDFYLNFMVFNTENIMSIHFKSFFFLFGKISRMTVGDTCGTQCNYSSAIYLYCKCPVSCLKYINQKYQHYDKPRMKKLL